MSKLWGNKGPISIMSWVFSPGPFLSIFPAILRLLHASVVQKIKLKTPIIFPHFHLPFQDGGWNLKNN